MSEYYKRDGTPVADYSEARGGDHRVGEDYVDGYCVSTVHLGLNHQFGEGPPLIFETMVFAAKGSEITSFMDLYCVRYSTEAEARAGHERVVAAVKDGTIEMYGETI
jgi:hypothetical protein